MSTTTPQDESTITRAMQEIDGDVKPEQPVSEVDLDPTPISPPDEESEVTVPEGDTQLDDIELQTAHRDWKIEGDIQVTRRDGSVEMRHFAKTYVQKPLSFTAMLQFTGLIGERLSEAMSGPDGLTVDGVLGEADGLISAGQGILSRQDFNSLDSFVKGLAKLAEHVPSVVEDCQCIWLRVPFAERPIVKDIWSRSPDDGGLSVAEGEEMLEIFLAQNYREVEDFFVERLPRLMRKVNKLRGLKNAVSPLSKRSSPTQADIPSQ